jgi:hypothetical protein
MWNNKVIALLTQIANGAFGSAGTGQASMANSMPVAIASDQSAVPVSLGKGQATMSNSVPVTVASDQSSMPVTVGNKGQATMANSLPVTVASDQSSLPVTVGNKGQATMANSVPVVVASDQGAVPVSMAGGATTPAKAGNAAAAATDTGMAMLAVRQDSLTVFNGASGEYAQPSVDKYGAALVKSFEKQAKTYSATVQVTPAASATDVATLTGSTGTAVMLTKIIISGQQTNGGKIDLSVVKRSTSDSGGTSAAGTAVPHISTDTAAAAAVAGYSANPTALGTLTGVLRRFAYFLGGSASQDTPLVIDFGDKGKGIQLVTSAQQVAVNLNGTTVTGGTLDITFEWIEI